jgi:hypothetical protein
MKTALMAALAAVVACGGASKPDSAAPLETARDSQKHETGHTGHMGGSGADEMAGMPPKIAKFHATLAPRWHAAQGPQRMTDTCATVAELRGEADAIAAADPPGGSDAAAWSAGGKQLALAVLALDRACKASDGAAFEAAFAEVHERFHDVLALAGGEHEHDEGHGDDHHHH